MKYLLFTCFVALQWVGCTPKAASPVVAPTPPKPVEVAPKPVEAVVAPAAPVAPAPPAAPSQSGRWRYTIFNTPPGDISGYLNLAEDLGGTVSNEVFAEPSTLKNPSLAGDEYKADLMVTLSDGQLFNCKIKIIFNGDNFDGTIYVSEMAQNFSMKGKRVE